ncbi:hypothetical protein AAVH_16818 [Aphelenchoides avenae]|nr:hypothetical protein AAVH_16818 [Aphelenchus avenae]
MSLKRKSYSLEDKLAAIAMAKKKNNYKAAAHFLTDECSIRRWRLYEEPIKEDRKKNGIIGKRMKGGGGQGIRRQACSLEALVLDDEDAVLLDVSDSEGGEDSDSDASIESESSSEDGPSQIRTQHATTSRRGAGCTYTADCQCELCDDDFQVDVHLLHLLVDLLV